MFYTTKDGINLDFNICGNGKPIVLISGFGSYQDIWLNQLKYLKQMGCYQVITFDHRNQGKSERTKTGHTLQQLTNDLISLLDYLSITKALFIGHSMGGSVLCNLLKSKPNLVSSGIIVDQSPYMLNTPQWPYGFMNYTIENLDTEILKNRHVKETLHGVNSIVLNKLLDDKSKFPFSRAKNIDLLENHIKLDWRKTLIKSQKNLLIISAKHSPYYKIGYGRWLNERNNYINSIVLDNTGHDIMAEIPDQFNRIMRHFMSQKY